MNLETENRIASMLLKEAAELRRQAEQEGVLAYLKKPSVRARPNSRFLTSTVRGVEQANKAVEVNEMWRVRQKEIELDNRTKGGSRHGNDHVSRHSVNRDSAITRSHSHDPSNRYSYMPSSSSRNQNGDHYRQDDEELRDDDGLKDDEVEEFLHSRATTRGRGSIGSRMDELGPYISQSSEPYSGRLVTSGHAREERWSRIALGPDRPSWKSRESSGDDESEDNCDKGKKSKKLSSECTKKHHSKKPKYKEKSRGKKMKKSRHEKRYK